MNKLESEIEDIVDRIGEILREHRNENRRLRNALATVALCKESDVESTVIRTTLRKYILAELREGEEYASDEE